MSAEKLPHELLAIIAGCLIGLAIRCARDYLKQGGVGILLLGLLSLLAGVGLATHVTTEVRMS